MRLGKNDNKRLYRYEQIYIPNSFEQHGNKTNTCQSKCMQIYVNTVKKNRFTIYLLFFFTFKRCTVAKDIYGTFMFDIHADGTVSLILCYHNVLELHFFLRTEFMQWHKSKMVGPKHCNLVGEIYRRCSYMNRRNNIKWFDGGLI